MDSQSNKPLTEMTKEEAQSWMEKLTVSHDTVVLNPDALKRFVELGILQPSKAESMEDFFRASHRHASELVNLLPPMPNWLEYQFQRPYYEARCCLLLGFSGASITLSAILLERVLKWTAFRVEYAKNRGAPEDWEKAWVAIEKNESFAKSVNYAKNQGLVDKKLSKKLEEFRVKIRNVQSHMSIHTAVQGSNFQNSTVVDVRLNTIELGQSVSATQTPTMAALAKEELDSRQAKDIFIFVHNCIKHLFASMDQRLGEISDRSAKES